MKRRHGFTLAELLITAVVMAILGTILARMLVQDSRFVGRVEAMMSARQTARAAVTIMSSEIRMAAPEGIIEIGSSKIGFRMPVAWGMACQRNGGNVIGSLVPTDSMTVASILSDGWGWLDATNTPQYFAGATTIVAAPRAECTADSIRTLPGGQTVEVVPSAALNAGDIPSGTIFFTYAIIEYWFGPSNLYPGRLGLFRWQGSSGTPPEEILGPFDSSSRLEFVMEANGPPTTATPTPAQVLNMDAVELVIIGESVETPRNATDPEEFELRTRVTLVN